MPPSRPQQKLPLTVLAVLFVAATIVYTGISIYYYSHPLTSAAFLGVDYGLDVATPGIVITRVLPGSPAEKAGLRAKDVVAAVNGRLLDTPNPFYDAVSRGLPGDTVRFTVRRGGEAAPVELRATLTSRPQRWSASPCCCCGGGSGTLGSSRCCSAAWRPAP
jgi:S1-C subfamily serine protease